MPVERTIISAEKRFANQWIYSCTMASLLEAQYPYQYVDDDGCDVTIAKGDRFLLINKSTEDWWKVQRVEAKKFADPGLKSVLYVPAAYMQEVFSAENKLKESEQYDATGIDGLKPISENHDYMNLNTYRNMMGSASGSHITNGSQGASGEENKSSSNGPRYENLASITNTFGTGTPIPDFAGRKSPVSPVGGLVENGEKSPRLSPKSETGAFPSLTSVQTNDHRNERLSSSSYGVSDDSELDVLEKQDREMLSKSFDEQENIYDQAGMVLRSESLRANNPILNRKSLTLPIGGLPSEWRRVTDNSSGRPYYFNERTQESAWKPPRLSAYFDQRSDDEEDDSNENEETLESDSDAPPGWMLELDEDGNETIYVNSVTRERWKSCRDDNGQVYYYQMDGDCTAWELPPVEVHYRNLRRRSVDDILEEKRFTQASLRNSKCRSVMIDLANNSLQHPPPIPPGSSSPDGITKGSHRRSRSALAYDALGLSTPDLHTAPLTILEGKKVNIVEREGLLFRRKVAEGGKAIKRSNWQQCYVVKYGSTLVFYKDQKSAAPRAGFPNGKPESSLDLRGAILEHVPKDKSRGKKHVFQVRTYSGGNVMQLFADNVQSMGRWITCIQTTIKRLEEEEPLPIEDAESVESVLDSVDGGTSPTTPTSSQPLQLPSPSTLAPPPPTKNRGPGGPVEKGFRGFSRRLSKRGQISSDKDDDKEKTKIKDKLKKFMARRPSYSELEKKGIIKDQVFGCSISKLCAREGTSVPNFVSMSIRIIEEKGLDCDGIYRVCGNVSMVQKLRILVDHEETIQFSDHQWDDVHIFTGALKLYFRELPEPLFPYDLFDQFVDAIRRPTKQEKLKSCRQLVAKLPSPNLDTIIVLFKHLKRVISRSSKNRMQSQNISIVFGPTLLRPEHETSNMALNMVYQNQIVDFMLQEFDSIFGIN